MAFRCRPASPIGDDAPEISQIVANRQNSMSMLKIPRSAKRNRGHPSAARPSEERGEIPSVIFS
jgi:hypothetical protein